MLLYTEMTCLQPRHLARMRGQHRVCAHAAAVFGQQIQRVRVNDRDELIKQKNGEQKKRYRDVYGSVIEKDAPSDAVK